jgi:predicted NUDIX family phosphoesterase
VSDPDTELVLGVPRARLWQGAGWRGLREQGIESILAVVGAEAAFRPRAEVEHDPSWKQVIPYVVLRDGARVFLMRRSRAGGDPRLHERYSIGVGGHVNPADGDLHGGLLREWQEEIDAAFVPEFRLLGLLNDDTDPVGAVHLGVVFEADAGGRPVAVRETQKLAGEFATFDEVRAVIDGLETWSQLVFAHLERTR